MARGVMPPSGATPADEMDLDAGEGPAGPAILPQNVPLPEDVDMEIVEHPEESLSMWGHRLRQNIRSNLQRRGVDMELIDGPESPSSQGQGPPQNISKSEGQDEHVVERTRSATPQGFAPPKDVARYPKILLEGMSSRRPHSLCKLCIRILNSITAHHVHPKVSGKRRAPPGVKEKDIDLLETIPLCRPCHTIIHMAIPNKLMSDRYYTLDQLKSHPHVQFWITWVRRQPIPTSRSRPQLMPAPVLQPTKKPRAPRHKLSRKDKSKSAQERAKLGIDLVSKIKGALAKLWSNSGDDIPRSLGDKMALQKKLSELVGGDLIRLKNIRSVMTLIPKYDGWYKWAFPAAPAPGTATTQTQIARLAAADAREETIRRRNESALKVRDALEKIWRDNGNDFPRFPVTVESRGKALQAAIKEHIGPLPLKNRKVRRSMQHDSKYRMWFKWTYPSMIWIPSGHNVTRSGRVYHRDPADDTSDEEGEDDDSDDEVGCGNVPGSHGRGVRDFEQDLKGHGGAASHVASTGTGSRADPIVFDFTEDEDEAVHPVGRRAVEETPSSRVTIDLTMEDDDAVVIDPVQQVDDGGAALPGFFFDFGGGHTRGVGFSNV